MYKVDHDLRSCRKLGRDGMNEKPITSSFRRFMCSSEALNFSGSW